MPTLISISYLFLWKILFYFVLHGVLQLHSPLSLLYLANDLPPSFILTGYSSLSGCYLLFLSLSSNLLRPSHCASFSFYFLSTLPHFIRFVILKNSRIPHLQFDFFSVFLPLTLKINFSITLIFYPVVFSCNLLQVLIANEFS